MQTKPVNMRLPEESLTCLEKIKEIVHAQSRTHAVKMAIRLSHEVLDGLQNGNEIIIKKPDGSERRLLIVF
jgi:hypothetical protein